MTQTACERVSRPALTKPTVATVTALDDCTVAVRHVPVTRPRRGELVHAASTLRSVAPAATFKPSVISHIPSRNRPMPPSRVVTTSAIVMKT